jgi:hypothetical protein
MLTGEHRLIVVRKIFGPGRKEVTGDWRNLYDEELYDLCWSSHIMSVIRWRLSWTGRVACRGNLKERYHLEDLGVEGMIILKWIAIKRNIKMDHNKEWTVCIWLWMWTSGRLY